MTQDSSSSQPASDALRDFAARTRDRAQLQRLDDAAATVLATFTGAGVDALLLKGPALARALYEDEHRPYSDVDLLVAPGQVAAARTLLSQLGYVSISDGLGIDDVANAADAEAWGRVSSPDEAGVTVDLHWRLPGVHGPADLAWEALWARRVEIEVGGQRVATLDAPGLALHVALHAAQHAVRTGKPIADLQRGVERWPATVWDTAAGLAGEIDATEMLAVGLRLTDDGAALATALGLPEADAAAWNVQHRHQRPRGTFHLDALAGATTTRERAEIIRRSLLPRAAWIRWQYRWTRHGLALLPAAYAVHILRAPAWMLRAWRFRRARRRAGG